jgi:hypothetical protein
MLNNARRNITAALAALVFTAALAASASPAFAEQGNMNRALDRLNAALESLRAATPNKGGHRERAMDLTRRAINQVNDGIVWADEHR